MNIYLKAALCLEEWHHIFLSYVKIFLYQEQLYDLTPGQMVLLYALKEESKSVSEITYSVFFWGANSHYTLNKLIRLGYLSRRQNPQDQRFFMIVLNDNARNLRKKFQAFLEGEFLKTAGLKNHFFSQEFLESLQTLFLPQPFVLKPQQKQ